MCGSRIGNAVLYFFYYFSSFGEGVFLFSLWVPLVNFFHSFDLIEGRVHFFMTHVQ